MPVSLEGKRWERERKFWWRTDYKVLTNELKKLRLCSAGDGKSLLAFNEESDKKAVSWENPSSCTSSSQLQILLPPISIAFLSLSARHCATLVNASFSVQTTHSGRFYNHPHFPASIPPVPDVEMGECILHVGWMWIGQRGQRADCSGFNSVPLPKSCPPGNSESDVLWK